MKEKLEINSWMLKEKELLEKLSLEISKDFSLSEKLAKRLIYKTHLSLEELKSEISLDESENKEAIDNWLDEDSLNRLILVLEGARKLIEEASKNEINELKEILEATQISATWNDSEIIKKILPEKILNKAKNPSNVSEHIMGMSLGILNTTIVITELLYDLGKGIIKTVPDLISILKWEAEIESFKRV